LKFIFTAFADLSLGEAILAFIPLLKRLGGKRQFCSCKAFFIAISNQWIRTKCRIADVGDPDLNKFADLDFSAKKNFNLKQSYF
jgi:hypothetical protein